MDSIKNIQRPEQDLTVATALAKAFCNIPKAKQESTTMYIKGVVDGVGLAEKLAVQTASGHAG